MTQQKKQSAWYRLFHPANYDTSFSPSLQNLSALTEQKIITEQEDGAIVLVQKAIDQVVEKI
jgi:hypothetical protein